MKKIDILLETIQQIYHLLLSQQSNSTLQTSQESPMTRQQVKDFLGISESTYKRKVKEGTLKPIKLPGGDRFYKSELISQYKESQRRGRT
ncbi:AlpA family transcriptional regulator [Pedobacter sp. SYP-B3415]|uniref:helix-turn-helix transcriptional regulator n=1 Tax=Pedobacter sp. SYP-B3415 TaxID=2496641 RepID=UPI00101C4EE7|nr:helix-turn-helix domain-containing protein [Pedobacter sp. SYP-B3415]